jgi:hypothetical protein
MFHRRNRRLTGILAFSTGIVAMFAIAGAGAAPAAAGADGDGIGTAKFTTEKGVSKFSANSTAAPPISRPAIRSWASASK